jgi:heat shock protein HtpX
MATMVGLIATASDAMVRIAWRGGLHASGSHRRSKQRSGGAALIVLMVVAGLLSVLAPLAALAVQMASSRRREYLADAGAAELTRHPEGLASALRKLAEDTEPLVETANRGTAHLYIVNPLRRRRGGSDRSSLFSSHPPLADRIARLLALTR